MDSIVNSILANADYFVLLLFRVGALFITSPIFGRRNIPNIVKIGFLGALTYLFFVIGPEPLEIVYATLFDYFLLILKEVVVGVALGYVTTAFFSLTYISGQIIDMQLGLGIVNVYDVQSNTQVPIVGNILNIVMLLCFFIANGHQRLIYVVYLTLEALPIGSIVLSGELALTALEIFANTFAIGVMVALPMIASGLILEITFGALARTVPQLNMFVVGIPIKTLLGYVMLMVLIPLFIRMSGSIFDQMFEAIDMMFTVLHG